MCRERVAGPCQLHGPPSDGPVGALRPHAGVAVRWVYHWVGGWAARTDGWDGCVGGRVSTCPTGSATTGLPHRQSINPPLDGSPCHRSPLQAAARRTPPSSSASAATGRPPLRGETCSPPCAASTQTPGEGAGQCGLQERRGLFHKQGMFAPVPVPVPVRHSPPTHPPTLPLDLTLAPPQDRRRQAGRHQPVPGHLCACAGAAAPVGPGWRRLPAHGWVVALSGPFEARCFAVGSLVLRAGWRSARLCPPSAAACWL